MRAEKSGYILLWLLAVMTSMTDIMGFVFGKTMGKHKMGWRLSPNKTREGYIGGLVGQLFATSIAGYAFQYFLDLPEIPPLQLLGIAGVIYILAVTGDLSESLIKRSAGVKDSGKIIPGHGGVLDRIDSYLLTLPGYYMIQQFFL